MTPTGTTFAVGAQGAFMRFDGTQWKAAVVSKPMGQPKELGYPQLRAVAAIADDDVWMAGDYGALFHFDGKTVTSLELDGRFDFIGLWGAAKDDVWLVAKQGSVFHFDGSTWSESFAGDREIVSFWATSSDDIYTLSKAVNSSSTPPRLLHFDGSAWTARPMKGDIEADPHDFVAVSAAVRGQPWIASTGAVYRGDANGNFRSQLSVPHDAVRDLVVVGKDDAWYVDYGWAVQISSGEMASPSKRLSLGPNGSVWAFGDGGWIHSTQDLSDPVKNVTPPIPDTPDEFKLPTRCNARGDTLACVGDKVRSYRRVPGASSEVSLLSNDDPGYGDYVRVNAHGDIAHVSASWVTLRARDGAERNLAVATAKLDDLQLLDDGSMLAIDGKGTIRRAAPGAAMFADVAPWPSTVAAGPSLDSGTVHRPDGNTVWVTNQYTDPQGHWHLLVRDPKGAVVDDALLSGALATATVTTSGTVILATFNQQQGSIVQRRGGTSDDLSLPAPNSGVAGQGKTLLAASGEDIYYVPVTFDDPVSGTRLYRLHDGTASRVILPLQEVYGLYPQPDGVFVQSAQGSTLFVPAWN
ncbi:hypothetical protein AKJ09_06927 [Labilithrix luteola]|uniref:Uncharacterized protein n=1 Tax=Labilithrix luteola TaxID=1391654 RepID=A0A0K1Q3C2_9BACT|nr:hypothetical protein [Labilithrix luteola]AKV00264.1 hypothetical protein AKJ09_06927 [Labilithrix luteola]